MSYNFLCIIDTCILFLICITSLFLYVHYGAFIALSGTILAIVIYKVFFELGVLCAHNENRK